MEKRAPWPHIIFVIMATALFAFGCVHKGGKLYTIAKDPTWEPLDFKQNQGAVNTFLSALLLQIAKEKRFQVDLVDLAEEQLIYALRNEEVDALLSTITPSEQTRALFDFSEPILALGPVLVVNKRSKITKLADLDSKIVGLSPFDDSVLIAQEIPAAIIREFASMPHALEALERQEIDGLLMNAIEAEQLTSTVYKETLEVMTPPLTDEAIRLVVLQERHKPLLKKVNDALANLKKKSFYDQLKNTFSLPAVAATCAHTFPSLFFTSAQLHYSEFISK